MIDPEPTTMLSGGRVYRVVSQLGTDLLVGHCWCGASHQGETPVELWQWLLAHPDTHDDATVAPAPDVGVPRHS